MLSADKTQQESVGRESKDEAKNRPTAVAQQASKDQFMQRKALNSQMCLERKV